LIEESVEMHEDAPLARSRAAADRYRIDEATLDTRVAASRE